jgi:hypothetical protein
MLACINVTGDRSLQLIGARCAFSRASPRAPAHALSMGVLTGVTRRGATLLVTKRQFGQDELGTAGSYWKDGDGEASPRFVKSKCEPRCVLFLPRSPTMGLCRRTPHTKIRRSQLLEFCG